MDFSMKILMIRIIKVYFFKKILLYMLDKMSKTFIEIWVNFKQTNVVFAI